MFWPVNSEASDRTTPTRPRLRRRDMRASAASGEGALAQKNRMRTHPFSTIEGMTAYVRQSAPTAGTSATVRICRRARFCSILGDAPRGYVVPLPARGKIPNAVRRSAARRLALDQVSPDYPEERLERAPTLFEELAGAEEGALMTRVFFSSWRPVYRPAGGMLRRARRNHLLGPTGNPPSIVPGPFLAYLSPGPASTVLPYRRQDWPGPASGIDQDAGTLPSDAVVNAFSTAPFEVTFRPPDDGGDIYAVRADGPAVALKTKDGGVPKDIFFCGDNWILWGADVGPDWRSVTANIYQAPGASCRPQKRTGPAYTRYIEATIDVPFIGLQTRTRAIDTPSSTSTMTDPR